MNDALTSRITGLLLFFAAATGVASEHTASSDLADKSDAIIDGVTGSVSTYSFMAFLADADGEQYCGASLITETWLLTAAHCFLNGAGDAIDLVTGAQSSVVLNSDTVVPLATDAEEGQIGQIVIHPLYNPDPASSDNVDDFDIALVELTAAVDFQPVKLLAADAAAIPAGTEAIIMGWGATGVDEDNESINPANELLVASQQIIGQKDCEAIYETGITPNMLCAGAVEPQGIADTCQGDSGGPLVLARDTDFVQLGIVSFGGTETGPACGDPDAPGVYARVSALAGFIAEHVEDADFVSLADAQSPPATAAELTVQVDGNQVLIQWSSVAAATGYRLYYAPYPEQAPIESIDMGTELAISGELPPGSAYYVAVEAYNGSGSLPDISNVEVFTVD